MPEQVQRQLTSGDKASAMLPVGPSGAQSGVIEACTITATGELQGSATAVQGPNVAARFVRYKAVADNAGSVYLGLAGVTVPDGTTDATSGFELAAGDETGWIPCTNLNTHYRICANAGDDLVYMVAS